jgi:hypothetical protein
MAIQEDSEGYLNPQKEHADWPAWDLDHDQLNCSP